jgi:hypothetical protein
MKFEYQSFHQQHQKIVELPAVFGAPDQSGFGVGFSHAGRMPPATTAASAAAFRAETTVGEAIGRFFD